MALQFNDASQSINAPSATVLDINATDEVEINATLMDVNANLDVSGNILVADDKAIKFGSDEDVVMEYDEDGTDTLLISGGDVTIADDKKLFFGTGKDGHIEYDEDGNDRLVIGGAVVEFGKAIMGATDTSGSHTGNQTPDFDAFSNFVWTLTGNTTLQNPADEITGSGGVFVFIQDGTGSRTLALESEYKTSGDAGITLSTGAGDVDIIPYFVSASGSVIFGKVTKDMVGA